MKVVKACLSCNRSFTSYECQNKHYCSRLCLRQHLKTEQGRASRGEQIQATKVVRGTLKQQTRYCKQCSTGFPVRSSDKKQFCTSSCRYIYISENKQTMLDKQRATNIARYGGAYPTQNKQIVQGIRDTVAEKYGSQHPRFSDQAKIKRVQTCIDKYGKPYAPSFCSTSKDEQDLFEFVSSINPDLEVQQHNRTLLGGKEVDIYIPSLKLAIEYNGLYYHCEQRIPDRKYHLQKTRLLQHQGIRLIQIFSDEWINRRSIVESKLKALVGSTTKGLYARQCEVVQLDSQTAAKFLEQNHIQGADKSRHKLGLYYNQQLVAVMTFSVGRQIMGSTNQPGKWELSRFATSRRVVGAAGKLLASFRRAYDPTEIISYADRRWSVGQLYQTLGFDQVGYSAPSYWYTKDYRTRLYRYNFRKSVLVANGCDSCKTEWQIMQDLGYDRIWDCGTIKYKMKIR